MAFSKDEFVFCRHNMVWNVDSGSHADNVNGRVVGSHFVKRCAKFILEQATVTRPPSCVPFCISEER